MIKETEFKLFKCDCGYEGFRSNYNKICRRCGKEGKLVGTFLKEKKKNDY